MKQGGTWERTHIKRLKSFHKLAFDCVFSVDSSPALPLDDHNMRPEERINRPQYNVNILGAGIACYNYRMPDRWELSVIPSTGLYFPSNVLC